MLEGIPIPSAEWENGGHLSIHLLTIGTSAQDFRFLA